MPIVTMSSNETMLSGTNAERLALTTASLGSVQYTFFESDTNTTYEWKGTKWVQTKSNGSQNFIDGALALKTTIAGSVTYLAEAAPGTTQAASAWRVQKIDTTTGTVITWADGNSNFDNVATDLTALTYS